MRIRNAVALIMLIAVVSAVNLVCGADFNKEKFIEAGYVPLFNGRSLTGWKVPEGDNGHWKVVDGVIDYDAMSEAKGNKNLWTEESFGDFSLHIEWRLKRTTGLYSMPTILPDGSYKKNANGEVIKELRPNADSGIFLRGSGKAQLNIWCWPIGSGELWGYRNDKTQPAEVRAAAVPKVHADKPVGQWNEFDITMKGERLTVTLNSKIVIDNARLPGIPKTGPLALQHHGGMNKRTGELSPASSLIQFRNIWLKRLDADKQGFIPLFSGSDLTGWITGPDNAWVAEDGVLTIKRRMDGREHNADYLWTQDTYSDFILDLEFKIPERANSGIFLRTSDLGDPIQTGLEVQVANSYGRKKWSKGGCAGAIYDCLAPAKNTVKRPGEWNRYRITCNDNKIYVVLNGEQIIDMDLDRWTEPYKNPDKTENKFHRALKDFARKGHIGLQDHGRPVWYRNIRIKPLIREQLELEPGFLRLDNGRDLTGWFGSRWSGQKTGNSDGWSVTDGAIHLNSEVATSHLFSGKTFSNNAVIRLQFRAANGADSGLCLHGRQFQVRDYVNSLPDTKKYAPYCKPPGQWNDLEFDITDGVAVVKLNGKVIEKAWKLGDAADRGLGLQREFGDFDYRYIRLREKG